MIRITLTEECAVQHDDGRIETFTPVARVVEYPVCDGAMPFMGNPGLHALVKINKESPDGPHEVIAVIEGKNILNIEELPQ